MRSVRSARSRRDQSGACSPLNEVFDGQTIPDSDQPIPPTLRRAKAAVGAEGDAVHAIFRPAEPEITHGRGSTSQMRTV